MTLRKPAGNVGACGNECILASGDYGQSEFSGWANVAAGLIMSAAEAASLFVGKPAAFYIFFATIEIACTLLIAWFAWRWKETTAAATANS